MGSRTRQGLSVDNVAQQVQVARFVRDQLAVDLDRLPGDPVVDQLAHHRVGTDHDEHRRRRTVGLQRGLPMPEGFCVASM